MHAAEVPAQQVGVLREIVADEGTTVEAGAVLAKLDSRQAELDVAKAKLEAAQAAAKAGNRTKVEYAEKSLAVAAGRIAAVAGIGSAVRQEHLAIATGCRATDRREAGIRKETS